MSFSHPSSISEFCVYCSERELTIVTYEICDNESKDECNEEKKKQVSHVQGHTGECEGPCTDNQDGYKSHEHGSFLFEVGLAPVSIPSQKGSSLLNHIV